MEFTTKDEYQKYLKDHPDADKTKHTVKPSVKSPSNDDSDAATKDKPDAPKGNVKERQSLLDKVKAKFKGVSDHMREWLKGTDVHHVKAVLDEPTRKKMTADIAKKFTDNPDIVNQIVWRCTKKPWQGEFGNPDFPKGGDTKEITRICALANDVFRKNWQELMTPYEHSPEYAEDKASKADGLSKFRKRRLKEIGVALVPTVAALLSSSSLGGPPVMTIILGVAASAAIALVEAMVSPYSEGGKRTGKSASKAKKPTEADIHDKITKVITKALKDGISDKEMEVILSSGKNPFK